MNKIILTILFSGICYGLSFPSFENIPTGALAWVSFVPLFLLLKKKISFKAYFFCVLATISFGIIIGFWWTALYSWKALLVCIITQAPIISVPFLLHYFIQKKIGFNKALFCFPFCFCFVEWSLHYLPFHLQVYNFGYTQSNFIWLNQLVDVTGMWGLSFWIMALNAIVAYTIHKKENVFKACFLVLVLFIGPLLYSIWCFNFSPVLTINLPTNTTKVAIVQTNANAYTKYDSVEQQKNFNELISLADCTVVTYKPDLLVLPETAMPLPLFNDTSILNFTKRAVASWQTSVALGYVNYPDSANKIKYENNAIVFTPQLAMYWDSLKIKPENVKVYKKEFGLPFMETMPFFENNLALNGGVLMPGNTPYVFNYTNAKQEKFEVGLSICWEQMHPSKIAEIVNEGASFIALMNNDAWFGKSPGAEQLASITKLRAIENRRSIVRTSNGGISCFINEMGKVNKKLPWFTSSIAIENVVCSNELSFYTQYPNWFPIFCAVFSILFYGFYAFVKKTKVYIT
jgi:apolipoprotein N-acyltransferase